jgi:CPA1 family monovalent cation:H+ antiporter
MEPETRLRGRAVWEMVTFVLNGLVFILIGLQLATILPDLSSRSLLTLIGLGLLISLAAIAVRLAWVFGAAYLVRCLVCRAGRVKVIPRWQETLVVGWAGMRGVVSLATALALPLQTPERPVLLFLTFCVILVTLVGQGLTLPWLVRKLGVQEDVDASGHQELHARAAAAAAATERLEQLAAEWPNHMPLIDTLRAQYAHRSSHIGTHSDGEEEHPHLDEESEEELLEHRLIRRSVIDAERAAVLEMRRRGEIDDGMWRRNQRDLDLEEVRMEA